MLGHSSRATKCAANGNLAATAVVFDTPKSLRPPLRPPLLCLHRTPPSFIPFVSLASAKLPMSRLHWRLRGELKFEGNLFFLLLFFWTIFENFILLHVALFVLVQNNNFFLKRKEKQLRFFDDTFLTWK